MVTLLGSMACDYKDLELEAGKKKEVVVEEEAQLEVDVMTHVCF